MPSACFSRYFWRQNGFATCNGMDKSIPYKSNKSAFFYIVSQKRNTDFIKYDVEGSEYEALLGSQKTIQRCAPKLLVSLYHRSEDLFVLPRLVKQLNPSYRLYLRKLPYIPAWDLNLYALTDERNKDV